ncbi:MAG: SPFH domain-containing protein, partial [Planctomycetes bacterium]|nr:SPFH domain-containing protein [Planctomycetota bacterium]
MASVSAGQVQSHCALAGLEILEARISHLAYAPEIAPAMLRRQQATAVVAARSAIVEGAVGMVRLGIEHLERDAVCRLDDAARTRLVTNLLTVLV